MAEPLTGKLLRYLPRAPRHRYTLFAGTHDSNELKIAIEQLLSSKLNERETIDTYENLFASTVRARDAVSFGAGRMGLFALLGALELKPGDEVILPAYTCVVVPNALLYRGIKPVYVDIEARTFNIDASRIESAITPRTRALYLQHTFGLVSDPEPLRQIAKRRSLALIEDGAHALGAKFRGAPVGSLSEAGFFSTDHSKMVGTLLGGMVTLQDAGLASRVREIQRNTSFLPDSAVRRILATFIAEYVLLSPRALWLGNSLHALLRKLGLFYFFRDEMLTEKPSAYPCRLSSAQAKLGISQLEHLHLNLAHRRKVAEFLESKLGWYGDHLVGGMQDQAWLRYSFLVKDRAEFERRISSRFELSTWFTSIAHGRSTELEKVGYSAGSCPIAEKVSHHVVNFLTHSRIPFEVFEEILERNGDWIRSQLLRPEEL